MLLFFLYQNTSVNKSIQGALFNAESDKHLSMRFKNKSPDCRKDNPARIPHEKAGGLLVKQKEHDGQTREDHAWRIALGRFQR